MLKYIFLIILFSNSLEQSNVYMTKNITSSNIVNLFKHLNITLGEKIGLKVHSGEQGGIYFLTPDFLEEIYNYTKGTFIECNAAYEGQRHTTELHKKLLITHGWTNNSRRFEIMDADPSNDWNLTIDNPVMISENIVGEKLKNFDSCIVLSHLKGHSMGGFGGALKQLSIGFASQKGKTWIHTAGNITDWERMDDFLANQENFTAAMGDAAASIVQYFRAKKGIAFINVIANISLLCDCAGGFAPEPKINDIGILASTDPIAIDRASIDLIKNTTDIGTEEWLNQLESLKGENTIKVAESHGIGTQNYKLILVNDDDDEGEGEEEEEEREKEEEGKEEEEKEEEEEKKEREGEKEKEKEEDGKESKSTLIIIVISTIAGVSILISILVFCIMRPRNTTKYQEDFHLTQKMNQ